MNPWLPGAVDTSRPTFVSKTLSAPPLISSTAMLPPVLPMVLSTVPTLLKFVVPPVMFSTPLVTVVTPV